jgi:hypothetical protein
LERRKEKAMNRVSKIIAITTAAAIGGLSMVGSASARDWDHHRRDNGDAVAAGIAGLAAGVIAGAILSDPGPRRVYEAPPRYYYRDRQPVRYYHRDYDDGLQPWTPDWYRYCQDRYRSFDPRSGTFMGYDGQEHFCTAN